MSALVLALAAGAVVGLALGALGGGGGVLAVPALIYLLGFAPSDAATASLVIVTVTSATALYGHARDGWVRWRAGALFAAAGAGPAALAGVLADGVPRRVLTAAFAAVAVLAALRMLRGAPAEGAELPVRPVRATAAGAALGGVTGFLGVGGGFLAVPALVGVVGLRMRAAVGTSLLVITVNALTALVARAGTATALDWSVVAPFTGAAILAAWDGRRLAARVEPSALRRVFGAVLLAVAALMAADTLFVFRA
ncbi:sulfite exporter TauE/SafE family protein [Streptomyces sp. MUM 203J]|uniref:sulfite exporter TauE/SafE family protein n=1 Tax=Streptomyces sp. MUM 203J TaxID=2791990 RepID=UPI001F044521|nr:sulfite exporter TauE/SafE family protein [Streptomyces sp. MUM 203J]MCH0540790.1 sulfite exporter TauE/SafE family protein [Streptomyces sp. MUM 203J]